MRSFLSGWDTTSREPCALCGARATYGMVGTSDQPSGQQREAAAHLHAVKDLWYTMSASRSEATAEMGELLLRGWAMLAEACPQCHIPLMEEKPTGKKLCVGCQRTSWSTDASDRSQAEEDVSHAANKVDVSTDANRTDPSDLLAERMLQGWALLGVVCPVCRTPLVKNKEQVNPCQCLWVPLQVQICNVISARHLARAFLRLLKRVLSV